MSNLVSIHCKNWVCHVYHAPVHYPNTESNNLCGNKWLFFLRNTSPIDNNMNAASTTLVTSISVILWMITQFSERRDLPLKMKWLATTATGLAAAVTRCRVWSGRRLTLSQPDCRRNALPTHVTELPGLFPTTRVLLPNISFQFVLSLLGFWACFQS